MIDAREVIRTLRLPEQDEVEVQRLGSEIVAAIRSPKFDGRPLPVVIPAGDTDEERDRAYRIVCALKRRFEANLWATQLETHPDAVGAPMEHRLWLSVDAQAVRGAVQAALLRTQNGKTNGNGSQHGTGNGKLVQELKFIADEGAQLVPEKPTLSVILGTYNRLKYLQEAIRSARKAAGDLSLEFVVTDGGSSDGSREWLCAQPDVVLIALRRLEGAVPAFNSAFREARGVYIANFNDDAKYGNNVLVEGVKHLREHPNCGQVAFGLSDRGQVIVNEVYPKAQYPNASPSTYANFGIIRRSLAEKIARVQGGFWNDSYTTYCGDTELSAWVWKLGFSVDALSHLIVEDVQAQDDLRKKNMELAGAEAKRMYARWPAESFDPNGPEPRVSEEELARYRIERDRPLEEAAKKPLDDVTTMAGLCGFPEPSEERRVRAIGFAVRELDPVEGSLPARAEELRKERVLHVSLGTQQDPQAGQVRALQILGGEHYKEIRWFADYGQDHAARQKAVLDAAYEIKPTLVFMQLQMPNAIDIATVKKIREINSEAVIVDWGGDIGSHSSIWNLDWMVEFGRVIDLNLHASFSHVRMMRSLGLHNAAYLNIGLDESQYRPPLRAPTERSADGRPVMTEEDTKAVIYGDWRAKFRAYDACFLGNSYNNEDAFSKSVKWHDGDLRNEVVKKMKEAFGWKFCLYGTGWGRNVQRMSLGRSHEIYQRSKVGLSISLQNDLEAYSSDRLLRILGCGALLLVKRFAGMSMLGLDESNCITWNTADEAVAKAKLALDEKTDAIRLAGAELAREHHTWNVRMKELQLLVNAVRKARAQTRS